MRNKKEMAKAVLYIENEGSVFHSFRQKDNHHVVIIHVNRLTDLHESLSNYWQAKLATSSYYRWRYSLAQILLNQKCLTISVIFVKTNLATNQCVGTFLYYFSGMDGLPFPPLQAQEICCTLSFSVLHSATLCISGIYYVAGHLASVYQCFSPGRGHRDF